MTNRRASEEGIAIVTAVLIMMVVLGILATFSYVTLGHVNQSRSERQSTEATGWVQAAAEQLQGRLRAYDLAPDRLPVRTPKYDFWNVGFSGPQTLTITLPSGKTATGRYEVLPPMVGAPPNTVAFSRDPADPDGRGEIIALLRGQSGATDARPQDVRVVFRRSTLARFSIMSDQHVDLSTFGSATFDGSIHSNNVDGAPAGVTIGTADTSGAKVVSATSGSISGACSAARCLPDTEQAVSFTSIDRAFNQVNHLATNGGCARKVACAVNDNFGSISIPADHAPIYVVQLNGTAGCVNVALGYQPLRKDTGAVPVTSDVTPTAVAGSSTAYCPNPLVEYGGMALLFNTDVQLEGARALGSPPITIMTRNTLRPTVSVGGSSVQKALAASVYVAQTSGQSYIGTADPLNPVGVVAQGSIYTPSWAVTNGRNSNLWLRNVAMAAGEGELALGPHTLAMSGATVGNTSAGGGLDPCSAAASMFPGGAAIRIDGSVATRRVPILRYGDAGCTFGFNSRTYDYANDLTWNPPPLFPTDELWHVSEYANLAEAR